MNSGKQKESLIFSYSLQNDNNQSLDAEGERGLGTFTSEWRWNTECGYLLSQYPSIILVFGERYCVMWKSCIQQLSHIICVNESQGGRSNHVGSMCKGKRRKPRGTLKLARQKKSISRQHERIGQLKRTQKEPGRSERWVSKIVRYYIEMMYIDCIFGFNNNRTVITLSEVACFREF